MNLLDILFQGSNFTRLLLGLWVTVRIALISSGLAIAIGIPLGFVMRAKHKSIRFLTRIYLEFFRIMPQLVLLFVLYYELSQSLTGEECAIIIFALWGGAEMGDLVRGSIENIPRAQIEASASIGMTNWQQNVRIVLPLTVRSLVPVTVNLITRIIKTTSIVPLIGVIEVLKVGQQIVDFNRISFPTASITVYGIIFVFYLIICWPLSIASQRLAKKFAI
jgi:polar amino acid transport system permease protein